MAESIGRPVGSPEWLPARYCHPSSSNAADFESGRPLENSGPLSIEVGKVFALIAIPIPATGFLRCLLEKARGLHKVSALKRFGMWTGVQKGPRYGVGPWGRTGGKG